MTAALEGCEWSAVRPGCTLHPGKTWYPSYGRLGGRQGRSGRAENLVPTGIQSRTVQPVVSRYTDWATRPIYSEMYYDRINNTLEVLFVKMIKYVCVFVWFLCAGLSWETWPIWWTAWMVCIPFPWIWLHALEYPQRYSFVYRASCSWQGTMTERIISEQVSCVRQVYTAESWGAVCHTGHGI